MRRFRHRCAHWWLNGWEQRRFPRCSWRRRCRGCRVAKLTSVGWRREPSDKRGDVVARCPPAHAAGLLAPVAVGAGAASFAGTTPYRMVDLLITAPCAVVALALQVGVNYANDYSDGIRGTDATRVGPVRLVGQGLARPGAVKIAAFVAFGVAGVAGLALVLLTGLWWLLLVGAAAIAAAWFYTGGPRPHGYAGLGNSSSSSSSASWRSPAPPPASTDSSPPWRWSPRSPSERSRWRCWSSTTCATSRATPRRASAPRRATRRRPHPQLLRGAGVLPFLIVIGITIAGLFGFDWPALSALTLVAVPLAAAPARQVRAGAVGSELVEVLGETARLELIFCLLFAIGMALAGG